MTEIIIRDCGSIGWLPIIKINDEVAYRGEHEQDRLDAIERASRAMERLKEEGRV